GKRILSWLGLFHSPFVEDLLKGSVFITNLRLEWLSYFRQDHEVPAVVQVRGLQDPIVGEEDSADIRMLPRARLITIPGADHATLYGVDDSTEGKARYESLRDAILAPIPRTALPEDPTFGTATAVVFILHGIRANNYTWPSDLEQSIRGL